MEQRTSEEAEGGGEHGTEAGEKARGQEEQEEKGCMSKVVVVAMEEDEEDGQARAYQAKLAAASRRWKWKAQARRSPSSSPAPPRPRGRPPKLLPKPSPALANLQSNAIDPAIAQPYLPPPSLLARVSGEASLMPPPGLLARLQHHQPFPDSTQQTLSCPSKALLMQMMQVETSSVASKRRSRTQKPSGTGVPAQCPPLPPSGRSRRKRQRKGAIASGMSQPQCSRLQFSDAATHSAYSQDALENEESPSVASHQTEFDRANPHLYFPKYLSGMVPIYAEGAPSFMPYFPPLMPPIPAGSAGSPVPWLVPPIPSGEHEQKHTLGGEDADVPRSESEDETGSRSKSTKRKEGYLQSEQRGLQKPGRTHENSTGEKCNTEQHHRVLRTDVSISKAKGSRKHQSSRRRPKEIMKRIDSWDSVNTIVDCGLIHAPASKVLLQAPCKEAENVLRVIKTLKCPGSAAKGSPMDLLSAVGKLPKQGKKISTKLSRVQDPSLFSPSQIYEGTWQMQLPSLVTQKESSKHPIESCYN